MAKSVTGAFGAAAFGLSIFGTALASAETPIAVEGWVTTPGFGDPMPFPTAHYAGSVTAPGSIRIWADCIKGGLGGPGAPCVTTETYWGIDDRVLNWQNVSSGQSGQVQSDTDGAFVAETGPGQVNLQILKPGNGVGVATASFSS